MNPPGLLTILTAAALLVACAAPIPPHSSEAPPEASSAPGANQPSIVESTSAEYEGESSSAGSSGR